MSAVFRGREGEGILGSNTLAAITALCSPRAKRSPVLSRRREMGLLRWGEGRDVVHAWGMGGGGGVCVDDEVEILLIFMPVFFGFGSSLLSVMETWEVRLRWVRVAILYCSRGWMEEVGGSNHSSRSLASQYRSPIPSSRQCCPLSISNNTIVTALYLDSLELRQETAVVEGQEPRFSV